MQSIVKKQFVQVDALADRPGQRQSASGSRCKKSVRLLRLGAVVQALELTCSCGEVTVVELEYPAPKE